MGHEAEAGRLWLSTGPNQASFALQPGLSLRMLWRSQPLPLRKTQTPFSLVNQPTEII